MKKLSSPSTGPQTPIERLHHHICAWLKIDWHSLRASAASKPTRGKFQEVTKLLARETEIPEPPLADWLTGLTIRQTTKNVPQKTWCLHKKIDPPGSGSEEILERAIVRHSTKTWFNQLTVASGFNVEGPRKAMDLVLQLDSRGSRFRFIEMKAIRGTNNPVFAAVELIQYGLLYRWFRDNQRHIRLPQGSRTLLDASHIEFEVLAPKEYYLCGEYPLAPLLGLERKLNSAFGILGNGLPSMSFRFAYVDFPLKPDEQVPLLTNPKIMDKFADPFPLRELR